MSYILDALQRTETTGSTPPAIQPAVPVAPALTLPWKLAIGAILLLNVVFVSLWLSNRGEQVVTARAAGSNNSGVGSDITPSTGINQRANQNEGAKKTLPGILSPRPASRPATGSGYGSGTDQTAQIPSQTIQSGTARTFKPSGAKITIAQPSRPEPTAPKNTKTVRLSQLSDSAREALYVLTFSTHIYGSDADLRAVVVNGQRLTEGDSVTADNGQEFLLQEITDSGVILQFDHDGETESVLIAAVMENWQDG